MLHTRGRRLDARLLGGWGVRRFDGSHVGKIVDVGNDSAEMSAHGHFRCGDTTKRCGPGERDGARCGLASVKCAAWMTVDNM